MEQVARLASFCRLCLNKLAGKASDKVPVFNDDAVGQLLELIEIAIDPDVEPEAVVCFDCIVTLEGFFQFKEQCHVNDQFVRTVPKNDDDIQELGSSDEEVAEEFVEDDNDSLQEAVIEELDSDYAEPTPTKRSASTHNDVGPDRKRQRKTAPGGSPKKANNKGTLREYLDPEQIDAECKQLKVPIKSTEGPTIDQLQVLQDSYPDFFHFEKGPRSVHYTLVFYGERFNCATFTQRYTYWKCMHRRKYMCPAQVCCSNDYRWFERRFEHTHEDLPEKEGLQFFSPRDALPHLFKICRNIALQRKARRRKAMLEKHKQKLLEESAVELEGVHSEYLVESDEDDENVDDDTLADVLRKSGVLDEEAATEN